MNKKIAAIVAITGLTIASSVAPSHGRPTSKAIHRTVRPGVKTKATARRRAAPTYHHSLTLDAGPLRYDI